MRFINFIARALDTVVSPMVYVMTSVSVIVGFAFTFLDDYKDVQRTVLYQHGIPAFKFSVWGAILLVSACLTLWGLIHKKRIPTEAGAFVAFLMWGFASFTYLINGFYLLLIIWGLFQMTFFGYVYLTSSLGVINRVAVRKLEKEHGED